MSDNDETKEMPAGRRLSDGKPKKKSGRPRKKTAAADLKDVPAHPHEQLPYRLDRENRAPEEKLTVVEEFPDGSKLYSDGTTRDSKGLFVKGTKHPSTRKSGTRHGDRKVFTKRIIRALSEGITDEQFQDLTQLAIAETPHEVWKILSTSALKENAATNINITNGEAQAGFWAGAPVPSKDTLFDDGDVERLDHEANAENRQQFGRALSAWLENKLEDYYSKLEG